MPRSSSAFHDLKDSAGHLTVPIHTEAVTLVIDLEARGITLTPDHDGSIVARPRHRLTDDDRAAIRRLRPHVLHALAYTASGVH